MMASRMTLEELALHLKAEKEKLHYFWKYRTEQRRATGTQIYSPSIRSAMQRGANKSYN